MSSYELLIQKCDLAIKQGRSHDVSKALAKLQSARIPRKWRMPLAKICRRAGLYTLGLSLLARLVHADSNHKKATSSEIAEYAVLLLRFGALPEAMNYLQALNPEQTPESLLYRAYAYFLRWEFALAIPHLEKYLRAPLEPYARLVGEINLAYALVESRNSKSALNLLNEVIQKCSDNGSLLLEGNGRAYRAQLYFQQNDISKAQEEILAAKRHFSVTASNDHFLILKWELILAGIAENRLEPFQKLHQLGLQNRDWAASREADFYSLKVKFDRDKFLHLYFGSPFELFRRELRQEFHFEPDLQTYRIGSPAGLCLDIRSGQINDRSVLIPGGQSHQLIDILLRDFYQPLRIGSIFSALHPSEHFDVNSSPDRVHKTIRRARQWLTEQKIPVEIINDEGFYSLKIHGNFSFTVSLNCETVDTSAIQFQTLEKIFQPGQSFSAKEAREKLLIPKTSLRRLLDWGEAHGKIQQVGTTPREAKYVIPMNNMGSTLKTAA